MVSLAQLWVPILLSAILVFVASSIIHMLIQWHKGDYKGLQNEDEVRAAIRKGNPPPAMYVLPFCSDMKKMGEPEMQKKYAEGPNAVLTIIKPGLPSMGPMLGKWFLYNLFISLVVACLAARVFPPGTGYLPVFKVAGLAAWLGYAGATPSGSIWMGRPWSISIKDMVDGLIYAGMTAGSFGWLWPKLAA